MPQVSQDCINSIASSNNFGGIYSEIFRACKVSVSDSGCALSAKPCFWVISVCVLELLRVNEVLVKQLQGAEQEPAVVHEKLRTVPEEQSQKCSISYICI